MTYKQFTEKYNGRFVDYDHAYGNQCVDLMRQYCKDVLGVDGYVAIPPRGNAKDIFKNFKDNKYFKKVLNTPTGIPPQGSVIFWGTYPFVTGIPGHVAIVDSASVYNTIVFNQNYPTNSACNLRKFDYRGVLGWLKRK